MLSEPVKDAAALIGEFYLQKNDHNYIATERELINLRITKLEIKENALHITSDRLGLLIGYRGSNIEALTKFIKEKMGLDIKIFEDTDCLYRHLIPEHPDSYLRGTNDY